MYTGLFLPIFTVFTGPGSPYSPFPAARQSMSGSLLPSLLFHTTLGCWVSSWVLWESEIPWSVHCAKPHSPRCGRHRLAATCLQPAVIQCPWFADQLGEPLSVPIDFPVDYITSNHKRNCAPLLECQGRMDSKHFPTGSSAPLSKALSSFPCH